jgi:hypothetical protein
VGDVLIWIIMAIVLVVIVAGGFGGRQYAKSKATKGQHDPHQGHHDDRKKSRSRGRGHH